MSDLTSLFAKRSAPGPDCERFAPLLPLVNEALVEEFAGVDGALAVRDHLQQCARCQQIVRSYDALDVLLCAEMRAPLRSWSHSQGESRTGESRTGESRTGESRTGESRTGESRTGESRTGALWELPYGASVEAASPSQARRMASQVTNSISNQRSSQVVSQAGAHQRGGSGKLFPLKRLARWLPGVAALLVLALASQAISSSVAIFMPDASRMPAPKWFTWVPSKAATQSAIPQVAFAASAHLAMCKQQHAVVMQTTWLVASQELGVALIEADCGSLGQPVAVTVIGRDTTGKQSCAGWRWLGGVYFGHRPSADFAPIADTAGRIPSGLQLSQKGYTVGALGSRGSPQFSMVLWLFTNKEMLVGRFKGTIERPSSASKVMVNGRPGWIETSNRQTMVFAPQEDNETFVLAGSAGAANFQELATEIFPRLSEIAPKPLDGGVASPGC
jgi:hypothetical protein